MREKRLNLESASIKTTLDGQKQVSEKTINNLKELNLF